MDFAVAANRKAGETGRAAAAFSRWLAWLKPPHRVFLSIFGSYAVAATSSAALALAMERTGAVSRAEALMWTILLGFFVYFAAALWSFAEQRPWRLWAVFGVAVSVSVWAVSVLGGDPTFGFGAR